MRDREMLLVDICRAYVTGEGVRSDFDSLDARSMGRIFDECAAHGITVVAYAVLRDMLAHRVDMRDVKLRWALSAERIAGRYRKQCLLAADAGYCLSAAGIDAVVFKGPALSRYYRRPEHRECGDLDIYTGCDMERASSALAAAGGVVEAVTLKNTHVLYKGLMIENHCSTTDARGRRSNREFEMLMRELLASRDSCRRIDDLQMLLPPVIFTAIHTLRHALHHYLWEGIAMRHLLDWALFVEAEQDNIDWPRFYALCEKYRLRAFADALTAIAAESCGVRLSHESITYDSVLGSRILHDVVMSCNHAGRSGSRTRMSTLLRFWSGRWKCRQLYDSNFFAEMVYIAKGSLFQRHLRL
ncbi:MAG: nucleotidyltransferase family protein [Alistipes sp.]|nr:nucleotidyltransferase family protein [Alistipes sp.]